MFTLMTGIFMYLSYSNSIKDVLCGRKTVNIKTVQNVNIHLIISLTNSFRYKNKRLFLIRTRVFRERSIVNSECQAIF